LSGSNIRLINENANKKILPAHSITGSKLEARQNITVHLEERLYCFATTIEAISLKLDVCSHLFFILYFFGDAATSNILFGGHVS